MKKELENPGKKKRPFRPKPAHQAQSRTRPPPLTGGPRLSAPVSFTRSLSLSLSRGPGSPVPSRCPRASPFLSLHRGPALSDPPSSCPPWTNACALAHVAEFLGHDACPRAQLSSYSRTGAPRTPLASFHTLSPSLALCPRRRRPAPASPTIQLAGVCAKPPRAPPRGETPVPVPNVPYCVLCSSNFAFAGVRPRRSAALAW
jgi:hypothetical protein